MTIGGLHTLHELTDLLAATDFQFKKIADAIASSPPTDARWLADWQTFSTGWLAYRAKVGEWVAGSHPLGPDATVAQTTDTVNLGDSDPTPHVTALGFDTGLEVPDWWHRTLVAAYPLQDLYNRWTALSGRKVNFSGVPQPGAPDADLNAYKAADAAVKEVEKTQRGLMPYAVGGLAALALVALIKLR